MSIITCKMNNLNKTTIFAQFKYNKKCIMSIKYTKKITVCKRTILSSSYQVKYESNNITL